MADNDMMVLEDAQDAVFRLSKAYKKALDDADLDAMTALKPKLDDAVDTLSGAREKLVAAGVVASDRDVADMRRIKGEIDQAASTQQLVEGAVQLVGVLRRFLA